MPRPRRAELHPRLGDFRKTSGLTQEEVAERVGISAEMVRRHERGISLPTRIYRERYCQVYRATEEQLGLRPTSVSHTEESKRPHPPNEPALLLLSPKVWTPDYIDSDSLTSVHQYIQQIVSLDNRFGGADLARLSARFFGTIHNHLGAGSYDQAIERELQAAAGELAELAGWLAYDADDQHLVRRMNQESLYFTRLAGDKAMELLTVQNASMHAGFLGRPREALQLANSVLEGSYFLSPRLRALFLTRKARALAQGGDEGALSVFRQVRSLYQDGTLDTDPPWAWWIDERELSWHEAMANQDLGNAVQALDFFERSVAATQPSEVRSQFLHRAYLLGGQVMAKSWSAAAQTMHDLEPLAKEVASTRTVVYLRSVLAKLETNQRELPDGFRDRAKGFRDVLDNAPA